MSAIEREGGDITAADMINETEPSLIQQYYDGTTVFITGGTGFLGKLLVEKLLRTCKNISKIFILIRAKNGKSGIERFEEYFNCTLFDRLKREHFLSLQKISILTGDCSLPNLGLSAASLNIIQQEVNCIFHCASTMRFNEKLSSAVSINIQATKDILKMSRKMHDLRSIVYVSSAFSFCTRRDIDELFYEPLMTGEEIITLTKTLKEETLEAITPILIGQWPNTYTFTKAISEEVIKTESNGLPIAIIRPSIVIGTAKEPVAGWVDTFNGASGVFTGVSLGIIRTLHCECNNLADVVPADFVVNCMMVAAWDIAVKRGVNLNNEVFLHSESTEIPIYNYVSSTEKPITWNRCMDIGTLHLDEVPMLSQVWHIIFLPSSYKYVYRFLQCVLHNVPAYLIDALGYCCGRKFGFVKFYKKIGIFLNEIAYFTSQQWIFRNKNTQRLWMKLNSEDKKCFEFSMKNLDWFSYYHTYVRGLRVYLLKDPLDTIPKSRIKRYKLKVYYYAIVLLILLMLFKFYTIL